MFDNPYFDFHSWAHTRFVTVITVPPPGSLGYVSRGRANRNGRLHQKDETHLCANRVCANMTVLNLVLHLSSLTLGWPVDRFGGVKCGWLGWRSGVHAAVAQRKPGRHDWVLSCLPGFLEVNFWTYMRSCLRFVCGSTHNLGLRFAQCVVHDATMQGQKLRRSR